MLNPTVWVVLTQLSDIYVSCKVKSHTVRPLKQSSHSGSISDHSGCFWLALCKDRSWCVLLIRLWFPGARDNSFNDLRYIWGGFAYLQDMMDHGIIRAQTSKTQPLGVYAQQMPYPCFVDDGWVQRLLSVSHVIRGRGKRYYSNKTQLTLGSCHSLPPHSWVIVLSVTLSPQISSRRLTLLCITCPFFITVLLFSECLVLSPIPDKVTALLVPLLKVNKKTGGCI